MFLETRYTDSTVFQQDYITYEYISCVSDKMYRGLPEHNAYRINTRTELSNTHILAARVQI